MQQHSKEVSKMEKGMSQIKNRNHQLAIQDKNHQKLTKTFTQYICWKSH